MSLATPSNFRLRASVVSSKTDWTTSPSTINASKMAIKGPDLKWPGWSGPSSVDVRSENLNEDVQKHFPQSVLPAPAMPASDEGCVAEKPDESLSGTTHTASSNGDPLALDTCEYSHLQNNTDSDVSNMSLLNQFYALKKFVAHEMKVMHSQIQVLQHEKEGFTNNAEPLLIPTQVEGPISSWLPLPIRNLAPFHHSELSKTLIFEQEVETFTLPFLTSFLGGAECSPGLYYPAGNAGLKKTWNGKTYYVMDAATEPFLPKQPGEHGAKLTAFFNEVDNGVNYTNVPLFVCTDNSSPAADTQENEILGAEKQYTYFGNYSQTRWSDKLDYDRMVEVVPEHVKNFWAEKLVDRQRPTWLTMALKEHFFPKPAYVGELPLGFAETDGEGTTGLSTDTTVADAERKRKVDEDVKEYIKELAEWQGEASLKVGLMKKENILKAFDKADADEEPGLRLWWEYLECVGFDRNFYYMLASAKRGKLSHPAQVEQASQ